MSNDCVIVPGLGGFVTHKINARYDEDDCIFLPPIRTLGFNPQLQINDSLLVISYVEAFDISYPEALRMIEAEVEELKQRLATEGNYEMNGIGNLYLNKEGVVVFEPCEAGVLTPDLYALSSFDFARLPIETTPVIAKEAAINTETTEPATTSTTESYATESEANDISSDSDDDDNYIHISATWLKAAVTAAAALLIAIILISPNEAVNGCYSQMSTWSTKLIQKLMPKDTNTETLRIQPQIKPIPVQKARKETSAIKAETAKKGIETAKKGIEAANKGIETAKVMPDYYTIVLASSITEKNANSYIQTLKNKGYNDAEVYDNGHIIRVVYGSFTSEQGAQDSLRKLRDSEDFQEAWVLNIKH